MIYIAEIVNKIRSDDPRTNNGVSKTSWPYVTHKQDDTIFIRENINDSGLVDFRVYNKYIKINRPIMEIVVAE
jgi:hypothetical protein